MACNLESFGLPEMLRCGRGIRSAAAGAGSIQEAAERICQFLYDELRTSADERACALVRFYKTHPYSRLPASQQAFAATLLDGGAPGALMRCLTLLGTVGDNPMWRDIRRSKAHRAIPLPSAEIVAKAPMIAQLIKQFGLDLASVIDPAPQVTLDREGKSYGVFHIEHAEGSPFIPAQDFVSRYGIRSVVGCGGQLRDNELFALILFSRVPIDPNAAERFRTLGLDVKATLFPYDESQVFARH